MSKSGQGHFEFFKWNSLAYTHYSPSRDLSKHYNLIHFRLVLKLSRFIWYPTNKDRLIQLTKART